MRPSFLGHPRHPTDPVERPTPPHPPVGGNGPSADCRGLAPVGGYGLGPAEGAGGSGKRGGGMTSRDAVFVESVSAMLKLAQSDPERARMALVARGDQVLAALRDSMLPAAKDSERIVALIDLYVQATFAMLLE